MEQTERCDKKKYNSTDLPSCFMTPESPGDHQFGRSAPSFDESSASCFLSPPLSQEKVFNYRTHLDSLQELPKLNLDFDDGDREESKKQIFQRSPLLPDDRIIGRRIGEQSVDFISEVLLLGCSAICEKICRFLEPQDLCRFASVSSRWRKFIQQNCHARDRWRGFVEQCKEHCIQMGKENQRTSLYQKSTSYTDVARLPFKTINLNTLHEHKQDLQKEVTETPHSQICSHPPTRQIRNELRPCPKCTSPSSTSFSHKGHFQCQKCGLRFCSVCLRDTAQHGNGKQCDGLSTITSRPDQRLRSRTSGKDIVGSKKVKDRVRRL